MTRERNVITDRARNGRRATNHTQCFRGRISQFEKPMTGVKKGSRTSSENRKGEEVGGSEILVHENQPDPKAKIT